MNWKRCGRKWSWLNLKYPGIYLEGLRNITKNHKYSRMIVELRTSSIRRNVTHSTFKILQVFFGWQKSFSYLLSVTFWLKWDATNTYTVSRFLQLLSLFTTGIWNVRTISFWSQQYNVWPQMDRIMGVLNIYFSNAVRSLHLFILSQPAALFCSEPEWRALLHLKILLYHWALL